MYDECSCEQFLNSLISKPQSIVLFGYHLQLSRKHARVERAHIRGRELSGVVFQ